MKATAEDQGAPGRDDYFGYGIVKAKAMSDYLTTHGCSGSNPPPGGGDLTASGTRSKGGNQLNLSWSGFTSNDVDVTISSSDGGLFTDTTTNDGKQSYSGSKGIEYTVTICESGTNNCAVTFTL
jgi:hypothetical protein